MSEPISILNDLVETLKDGQEGFRAAGEDVPPGALKTLFGEFSLQRSKFVGELQTLSRDLGVSNPENTSSVAGALHRGWINLKSVLSSKDEHAILAECERGEDSALATYKKALENTNLPAPIRDTIQSQYTAIKAAHDRVKMLRDSLAPK